MLGRVLGPKQLLKIALFGSPSKGLGAVKDGNTNPAGPSRPWYHNLGSMLNIFNCVFLATYLQFLEPPFPCLDLGIIDQEGIFSILPTFPP